MYPRIMNIRSEFKLKPGQKSRFKSLIKLMKARQSIGDLRENVWRWWNYKHIKHCCWTIIK
jgi:hypothetical protein